MTTDGYHVFGPGRSPFAAMPVNEQRVTIEPESMHRERNRRFRCCFGSCDEPERITFAQLYNTLAHGKPGHYILEGA